MREMKWKPEACLLNYVENILLNLRAIDMQQPWSDVLKPGMELDKNITQILNSS